MFSWIALALNVMTIFTGFPMDLAYAALNLIGAADFWKALDEDIPGVESNVFLIGVFELVMLGPLIRVILVFPVIRSAYRISGRFLAALVMAEDPQFLLAYTSSKRTEDLATILKCCFGCCSRISLTEAEAMRYLMSEEERKVFVEAGGLGKISEAILCKPLTAEEQQELQEWDVLVTDPCYCKGMCNPNLKDIVIQSKELSVNSCSFWIATGNFLWPWSIFPREPLPTRFLWIYKLQLMSAISTLTCYYYRVAEGKYEWWEPAKLVSVMLALKYLFGLKSLSEIWTEYPLDKYGIIVTGKFPANNMWESWCGAVMTSFEWGEYADVWEPVRADASESTEEDGSESESEKLLDGCLG